MRRTIPLAALPLLLLAAALPARAGDWKPYSSGAGRFTVTVPGAIAGFIVGTRAIRLLPAAALLGAVAMVAADTAARSVAQSTEVPVGVITALVGAPIFVWMLYRQYRRLEQ